MKLLTLLNESLSFYDIKKLICDYTIKLMKITDKDVIFSIKQLAVQTDEFHSDSIHDLIYAINHNNDYDEVCEFVQYSISDISEAIVDYYSDQMNHAPGFKLHKLKIVDSVSDKDCRDIANKINPDYIKTIENQEKKHKEDHKKTLKNDSLNVKTHFDEIVKIYKTHIEIPGWKSFFETLKKKNFKISKRDYEDWFYDGTYEQFNKENISSPDDLKEYIIKTSTSQNYVAIIHNNYINIDDVTDDVTDKIKKELPDSISYIEKAFYAIQRSKQLSDMFLAATK